MIKEKIIEKIRKNKRCKTLLQLALDKQAGTIQSYLDDNNIMLTTDKALRVISKELNIPQNEILAPVKTTA